MRQILSCAALFAAASMCSFASVDTALLALVPPGSRIVSSIDVAQAKSSPFGQYLLNRVNVDDGKFEEFTLQTGFDPRRDLDSLVFASSGPASHAAGQPAPRSRFAILARGTFNRQRIEDAAKAKGAAIQSLDGVDLILSSRNHQTGFAFLDNGVAVMADQTTLKQIVTNRGTPSVLDPALQALIYKAGTDNDAWFASLTPGAYLAHHIEKHTTEPVQGAHALESILQSSGGIRLGDIVHLSFDAVTRSPQDATSLSDVVRFMAGMVQMQREKDPRAGIMASALDNMDLATEGDSMHMSVSMPEKSLEQLAELRPRPRAHARPHAPSRN